MKQWRERCHFAVVIISVWIKRGNDAKVRTLCAYKTVLEQQAALKRCRLIGEWHIFKIIEINSLQ